MFRRYFRIEEHINEIEELDSLLPSPHQRRILQKAFDHFEKFQSITVNLQKEGLTLDHTRFLFDELCEDYPIMKEHLSKNASIVHNKTFESAVLKLLNNSENSLSTAEKSAIKSLLIKSSSGNSSDQEQDGNNMSYYEQIQQKRRKIDQKSKYIDCSFLTATSCSAERLFSMARWFLTSLRHRMSPIMFEAILFLKCNRRHWDLKIVSEALKASPNAKHVEFDNDLFYESFAVETKKQK